MNIRTTSARIGIESPRGQFDMQSKPGQLQISSPRADMQIRQPRGELLIDSSAAWLALGLGGPLETGNLKTGQANERTQEAIVRIVEKGNRMARITSKADAVAELAADALIQDSEGIRVTGPASNMNVKMQYIAHPAEIETTPHHPDIQFHVSKPDIQYTPGKVRIYMEQMNSIRMWASNKYDLYA
ncbi:hypothetical protein GE107_20740 [Cohnella sp. CFH 77786]|uniref:DUF6470 family protein n=1 Tax=Cohnella sp. CFH 77786 TaxID=2662265 RepID=UPI001C610197|nr:DUF6470 family protein [Cohnella sp. CFH 77786]MBW5448476.1 hypothetical protein [Cohnella sp. CFH 77786]